MGRYSFFISNFGTASNYVYADSLPNHDLFGGIDFAVSETSDSGDSSENIMDIDTDSDRQEESDSSEIIQDSGEESSPFDISQFGYTEPSDEGIKKRFWLFDSSLFTDVPEHVGEDGYVKQKLTRGVWGNTFFAQTTWGSGEFYDYIGPAFNGWRYNYTLDWRSRIDLLTNATKNSVWATNSRIDDTNYAVDRVNSALGTHTTNINNAFKRIATLETGQTSLNDYIGRVDTARVSNYNTLNTKINNNYSTLSTRISDNYATLWNRTVTLFNNDAILDSNITEVDNRVTSLSNYIGTGLGDLNSSNNVIKNLVTIIRDKILSIASDSGVIVNLLTIVRDKILTLTSDIAVTKNLTTIIRDKTLTIDSNLGKLTATNTDGKMILWDKLDNHYAELKNLGSLLGQTKNLVSIIRDKNIIFETALKNVNSNLSLINGSITAQTLSNVADTVLVTNALGEITNGISAISGQLDAFMDSNDKLWSSTDYNATVVDGDSSAVKLFKYQFAILKNTIVDTLNANQKNTQFLFDKYFGLEPGSAIYALRYTIVDGYTQTNELLQHIFDGLNLLAIGQNTTNGWLELFFQGIVDLKNTGAVITQWLNQIYEKQIIVPSMPFDFDRLQEMLDGLNFGNIVNEAGTNMWDFLKSLVDNLGNIISTGLTELGSTARKILDFLDSLIDDIIRLIVPENLDFLDKGFDSIKAKFDVKFDGILNVGGQIKDIFTPTESDFFSAISFSFMGASFVPDKSVADMFVPKFRTAFAVLIWLYVAWFVYRKLTGQGDIINDN
ncbi:hypothetical protein RV11_GL000578 [Enterococcus phoeniculicola]|uniref:Uncharacterized protein n=1 Tax=Enterococcus phoeniculicola ATCC BAA-412 TaxID=1158610 RepID=R3WEK2_9ENTE|nr:hypothetical protein [Enterococcus phoeniculicola]EOL46301.1 hypothetical protein UC3_01107 [Enterococcus phoeniculicola ATCC BAA-412]EOT76854.1 hypothetical protein I589_01815 [Enterococcus phoeniculicola ATCC BAA-412]OJG71288.1 hypothetical protein RV11_GL000578 [Enterococcus phoeniculicola]